MRLEDYESKSFDDFSGLYDRGSDENCPENNFLDCLNVDYEIGETKTRAGLSSSIVLGYGAGNGKVRRFENFITSQGIITLILDDSGNLYSYSSRTGDNATTPRLTVVGATDFAALQMLGKIFIAFSDGKNGLLGVNLKVFIPAATTGADEFRDAGGAAPSAASVMIAADGATGIVQAGVYKIAVAYITTSGNLTPPGPKVATIFSPTTYTAPGSKKINLSNIPVGPSGTAKRQILVTQANLDEYFFLPSEFGGLINNNTTTTAVLDFDTITDLIDSADYLFDVMESIPAPLGLYNFNDRLAVYGQKLQPNILQFSYTGEPEAFDSVDSIVIVDKDSGFEIRNALVMRNVFYTFTQLGLYATVDNNDIPATWKAISQDRSVDVPSHGVASFFATSGIRLARDWTLVVDLSGIMLFDGSLKKPTLTDNINDIWQSINFTYYHKIILIVDERSHKIYCSIPTGSSTENDTVLMGDYNNCQGNIPNYKQIRWAVWRFRPGGNARAATAMGLMFLTGETTPSLRIGSAEGGGKIWKLDSSVIGQDDGSDYESYFEMSLLYWLFGSIHTFNACYLRATGSGTLLSTIRGVDNVLSSNLPSITLSTSPGSDKLIRFSFENERAKLKFRVTSGKFTVSFVKVFGTIKYQMRPA